MKQKTRRRQKMKNNIIIGVAVIALLVVAIISYVHFSASTNAKPASTPSPAPTATPISWPNATLAIEPANTQLQTASVGQTIELNLTVTNVHDLWGWDISYLDFNSAVLNLTKVSEGPFLKSGGPTFFLSTASAPMVQQGFLPSVDDAFNENTTISGSGTLLTLTFRVVSAGTSPIDISSANLYNPYVLNQTDYVEGIHEAINTTIMNGTVTIGQISS